jgi:hypothetical protein
MVEARKKFSEWAKGFSGCDGGNPYGSIWFCGIEWGGGFSEDRLDQVFSDKFPEPPQLYTAAEENLAYQYNIKLMKMIAALRGQPTSGYEEVARETPFPFHQHSDFFKANLFPIAFKNVDARRWTEGFHGATGLATRDRYCDWCREHRFPVMRQWVEKYRPRLVIGVGRSFWSDYLRAFGRGDLIHEETVGQRKLIWTVANGGKTVVVVTPFLNYYRWCLNSDELIEAFGHRIRQIFADHFGDQISKAPAEASLAEPAA